MTDGSWSTNLFKETAASWSYPFISAPAVSKSAFHASPVVSRTEDKEIVAQSYESVGNT